MGKQSKINLQVILSLAVVHHIYVARFQLRGYSQNFCLHTLGMTITRRPSSLVEIPYPFLDLVASSQEYTIDHLNRNVDCIYSIDNLGMYMYMYIFIYAHGRVSQDISDTIGIALPESIVTH